MFNVYIIIGVNYFQITFPAPRYNLIGPESGENAAITSYLRNRVPFFAGACNIQVSGNLTPK